MRSTGVKGSIQAEKATWIQEMYLVSSHLSSISSWIAIIPLLIYMTIEFVWWCGSCDLINTNHSGMITLMSALFTVSLAYTGAVILFIVLRIVLFHKVSFLKRDLRESRSLRAINGFVFQMLIICVASIDYMAPAIKSLVAIYAVINPHFKLANFETEIAYTALCILLWLDLGLFIGLSLIKVTFLRPFVSRISNCYSKLDDPFESLYILLVPIKIVLIGLRGNLEQSRGVGVSQLLEGLIILASLLLLWNILRVHPYMEFRMNWIVGSHLALVSSLGLTRIILWTANWQRLLALALLMVPFVLMFTHKTLASFMPTSYLRLLKYLNAQHKSRNMLVKILEARETNTNDKVQKDILAFVRSQAFGEEHFHKFPRLEEAAKLLITVNAFSNKPTNVKVAEVVEKSTDEAEMIKIAQEVLVGAELENSKNPYYYFLKIEWLLIHFPSLHLILDSMAKLSKLATSAKSRYLFFYIQKEVEVFLKSYYRTSYGYKKTTMTDDELAEKQEDVNADLIIKGQKYSEKITSTMHYSSLDLAYVFYYKNQLENLVSQISQFTETNVSLLDIIQQKKGETKKLIESLDKLYSLHTKIKDSFADFNENTNEVEYNHYISYIYHLNFNLNHYQSARQLYQDFARRASQLHLCPDFKSAKITNDNLYVDSFYLMTDSDRKNQGRILDIFGNYHLFVDTHQEAIGMNYDVFFTSTVKHYHQAIVNCILDGSLENYRVMGSFFAGFVRLPGKDFVAYSNTVSKVVPFVDGGFKYITGIKPLLSYYEDKFFILLDSNFNIEGYSYNFLQLLPESFLLTTTNLRTLSSSTYQKISQLRETRVSLKVMPHQENRRGSIDSRSKITTSSQTRSYFEELRSSKMAMNHSSNHNQVMPPEEQRTLDDILKFTDKNGNLKTKKFSITIEHKEMLFCQEGYWYLALTLKEDLLSKHLKAGYSTSDDEPARKSSSEILDEIEANQEQSEILGIDDAVIQDPQSDKNQDENISIEEKEVKQLKFPNGMPLSAKQTVSDKHSIGTLGLWSVRNLHLPSE